MSNVATAVLSGNLTADPIVKHEKEGSPNIVELRLAVNRTRKDAAGELVEETSYFDLTVFGGFAGLVDRKLRVGDAITAKCRPEQQRWETEEGKRSKVVFIVEDIDGAGFFRKAEEVPAKKDGTTSAPSSSSSAAKPASDDIPF